MKNRLVIKSDFKLLDEVYQWLENLLVDITSKKKLNDILLVNQEMVTNSILHGNKESIEKEIIIEVFITSTDIILEITDQGEGIIKFPSLEESKELNYIEENGRGLKLAVLLTENIVIKGSKTQYIFTNE